MAYRILINVSLFLKMTTSSLKMKTHSVATIRLTDTDDGATAFCQAGGLALRGATQRAESVPFVLSRQLIAKFQEARTDYMMAYVGAAVLGLVALAVLIFFVILWRRLAASKLHVIQQHEARPAQVRFLESNWW